MQIPSSEHHPCSVRGLHFNDIENMDPQTLKMARNKDMHNIVKQCQTHSHSATCYKYWKGPPDPKECRFDLNEKNICPESYVDPESGELHLRCLDGLVNNFNATIIEAIRCNMDIKFIGSGPSAKAVLYYITDYTSKSQLKSHVAFAALELAVKKLDNEDNNEDDLTIKAKKLLQKCAYAMISHQELSAQQVCSYLMEYGDHYTSHEFKNLYWTAFEKFINDEDPSPECYSQRNCEDQLASHLDITQEIDEHIETNYENIPNNIDHSEQIDSSSTTELVSDDEIAIKVNNVGELIAHTSQIVDYQQRSEILNDLNLWNAIAQTEKIKKNKKQKQKTYEDKNEVYENEGNDNIELQDSTVNVNETHCMNELLTSSSHTRPRFDFLPNHPEYILHTLKMCLPLKRLVPVPIGPSIPRRDDEPVRERYCRLMLIFFKPWRHAHDLRNENETWSHAFEIFMTTCSPEIEKFIENMQILHECKDSRDDHFANRLSTTHNHGIRNLDGQSYSQINEDDFSGDKESEELILQHLVSIQDSRSNACVQAHQDVLTCLNHTKVTGLFSPTHVMHSNQPLEGHLCEEISEQQPLLEELWKKTYDDRKQEWKKKAQAIPEHTIHPIQSSSSADNTHNCNIRDGNAFRTAEITSDHEAHHATIQQNITPTDVDKDIDINEIVQEFTLNTEQARAFRIVAQHSLEQKPKPLRMYLGGPGGTGKSRVINALKAFFDRRNQSRRFRLSSYTGVAAKNISGMTLHAALCLNQRSSKNTSDKTRRDLISMWDGVDYLFIDEVSMIGCRLMLKISQALNDAKENQSPFGGMNVVFAGDFSQLPPVGDARLFSQINTHDIKTRRGQDNVLGKLLWLSVQTVVILDQIMRQTGEKNNKFVDLLQRLRQGCCTDEDYTLLNERQLKNIDVADENASWRKAPIIVSNNDVKDALNERATLDFAARVNREVHWYYSTDFHAGKIVSEPSLIAHLQKMNSGKTNQRLGRIPLVIGMPVMICQNFDVEGGVVNGCIGTLEKIRYRVDCEGVRHAISCQINAPSTTAPTLPDLPPQHVVALQDTVDMRFVHPHSHKSCTIKRTQVPIVPAFAMTAHKSQGQTMQQAIIDLQSCHGTESPYVMLSRVTSLEGLAILRPFDKRKIQCRQSEDSRREKKRLDFLRMHTIIQHGDESESASAQMILSNSQYREQINMDVEVPTIASDSARHLQHLQNSNYHLTSGPTLPKLSNDDITMGNSQDPPGMICHLVIRITYNFNSEKQQPPPAI